MSRPLSAAAAAFGGGLLFLLGTTIHQPAVALMAVQPPHVEFVTSPDGSTAYQCVIAASGIWCEHWADRE